MSKLNECKAKLMIAESRLRWYENAFALIRLACDSVAESEPCASFEAVGNIEKIVGGPVDVVGE